jgi:hypothetical protein
MELGNFALDANQRLNFEWIAEPLEKKLADRSLFFATASGMRSAVILRQYIEYCEEAARASGSHFVVEFSDQVYQESVKELQVVWVWLTLLEHNLASTPKWFIDFIQSSLFYCDQLHNKPKVKELLSFYSEFAVGEEVAQSASMKLCHVLGLGTTAADALLYLGDLLEQCQSFRAQDLAMALTQSESELDNAIRSDSLSWD